MKNFLINAVLFAIGSSILLGLMYILGFTKPESWITLVLMNMFQGGLSFVKAMRSRNG